MLTTLLQRMGLVLYSQWPAGAEEGGGGQAVCDHWGQMSIVRLCCSQTTPRNTLQCGFKGQRCTEMRSPQGMGFCRVC